MSVVTATRSWLGRHDGSRIKALLPGRTILFGIAALPLLATVAILAVVVVISFQDETRSYWTLQNFRDLYTSRFAYEALRNTFVFAFITVTVACTLAFPLAWIVERTNLRGRKIVLLLMTIGVIIPSFFTAMGWVLMFHTRIGVVNRWLGSAFGMEPRNIQTIWGMGWVMGLSLTSLAFIMLTASLRAMDPSLEEAAQIHGMGALSRIRRVMVPLVWPGLLATGLYVFVIGLSTFDVPATMGLSARVFTFSTYVYSYAVPANTVPKYGVVGASSAVLLITGLAISLWYLHTIKRSHRYAVVRGKGYRPYLVELSRGQAVACWAFIIGVLSLKILLPVLMLVWVSITPYLQTPSLEAFRTMTLANYSDLPWESIFETMRLTIWFAVAAATIVCFLGLVISWLVVRSKSRWSGVIDILSFIPHIIPSLIFAVGVLLLALFWIPKPFNMYGTIYIILAAFVVARMTFATRMFNSSFLQLHNELEEAALVSGMGLVRTIWRVTLPIIRPTIVVAWIWIAMMAARELTIAVMLATSVENTTLPVMIYHVWQSGYMQRSSAMTLIFLLMVTPIVIVYLWLTGRKGRGPATAVARGNKPAGPDGAPI